MGKSDRGEGGGFYITKVQAVIICLLFLLICVGVGLMAGLIPDRGTDEIILLPQNPDSDDGDGGDVEDGPWMDLRLPTYIQPVSYEMWFHPDFYYDGTTFMGRENITISITQETPYVLIHYKMMDITVTQLRYQTGEELQIASTFSYEPHEFWVIETTQPIPAGSTVVLHLEFNGSLVNGIVGYYKSTYVNSLTGVESWMATTKFQPTDARKAFPCFDEPAIKATFQVSLHHWSNFTGLSNTQVQGQVVEGEWTTTTFEPTLVMSTYLVAFIVTDFEYRENMLQPGDRVHRVWAAPDLINQTAYALTVTKDIFEYFEELFDYTYPLPKLDQVAVPDYPSGATEHWGVMTYRQAYLLYDEASVSASGKQTTAAIISHEVAHNYFGNEVTCNWWNEIWLNEGFAVYYEHHGVTVPEPDWEMDEHFVITTQQGVMRTDAGANSRSVVVEVETPEQINAAFDGITYDKGASMLRMIESYMGPDSFIKGIQLYYHNHLRSVAVTNDLWNALDEVAQEDGVNLGGLSIHEIMDPWVNQMGLPVITLTMQGGDIICNQTRFMNNKNLDPTQPPSDYGYVWSVPLTYTMQSDGEPAEQTIWLHTSEPESIPDPRPNPDTEWIKFNNEQKGFYRINYPADEWAKISAVLANVDTMEDFSAVDRSNLLDDAFNLARAGALDYDIALDMSEYLNQENHLFPWRSAKNGLDYIATMIYGESSYILWRKYIRDIASPVMEELGYDDNGDAHLESLLRNDIIQLTCDHGDGSCREEMQTMFAAWVADEHTPMSPTLRPLVYEFGIKFSDDASEWELMRDRYLLSTSSQERAYMLEAMAQTQTMFLVDSYLDFIENPENVRDQDFVTAVHYTGRNHVAYLYTWNWIKTKYEELEERFGIEDRTFARMVPDYVMDFNTEYLKSDVEQFYEDYPEAGAGELSRQQSLDSIDANIAWLADNLDTISQWLEARPTPTEETP